MSERCPSNVWGWRHRFEPRYDLDAPDLSRVTSVKAADPASTFDSMRKKTYVRDVCVYCGQTIEREKPNA